jgi:hypothetical protein
LTRHLIPDFQIDLRSIVVLVFDKEFVENKLHNATFTHLCTFIAQRATRLHCIRPPDDAIGIPLKGPTSIFILIFSGSRIQWASALLVDWESIPQAIIGSLGILWKVVPAAHII